MKVLLAVLFGVFGYFVVFARKTDCTNDETVCQVVGKCCVFNFHGVGKVCKSPGDEIGQYCGGDYFCAECGRGLSCTPLAVDNVTRPANGTCQMPVLNVPTMEDVRAMIADELQKYLPNKCPVPPTQAP